MSADIMTRVREIGRQLEVMKWGDEMSEFRDRVEDALHNMLRSDCFHSTSAWESPGHLHLFLTPFQHRRSQVLMEVFRRQTDRERAAWDRLHVPEHGLREADFEARAEQYADLLRRFFLSVEHDPDDPLEIVCSNPIGQSAKVTNYVKASHRPGACTEQGCLLCMVLGRG